MNIVRLPKFGEKHLESVSLVHVEAVEEARIILICDFGENGDFAASLTGEGKQSDTIVTLCDPGLKPHLRFEFVDDFGHSSSSHPDDFG